MAAQSISETQQLTTNGLLWCCAQVLDEPAAVQSDPTLLNLQLRALGKEPAGVKMQAMGSIPHSAPDR
jgi:hypothetical protein